MLLHSPNFAEGWNGLLGATRRTLQLDAKLRELAICVVGILNGAKYEVQQHTAPFFEAGGTPIELQALHDPESASSNTTLFSHTELVALQLAICMTRHIVVPASMLIRLRALLGSDSLVVELVAVISVYNMVSRFLVALDVDNE
jgi:alkylhydroperoxidase family enzyme